MTTLKRILVPTDLSDSARYAALYSRAFAARFGAEVSLLHVVPPFEFPFSMAEVPAFREHYLQSRNQAVGNVLGLFPGPSHNGTQFKREMREGDAAEEIVNLAHEGRFDAIIMPTRRASQLRQVLRMGSVTSKVLASVECPVVTGFHWPGAGDGLSIRSVVCAIDLGLATERVLCWGRDIASAFGARVTVVHAAPNPGDAASDYFDDTWRSTLVSRLHEHIGDILSHARSDAAVKVEAGPPTRVVISLAQELRSDLLIIGRGTSADLLGRLRANAWDMIRQSPCPVLSV